MFTPFTELDAVMHQHTETVRKILGSHFVGCYLQGSFALGAGDAESDADFIVVTQTPPAGDLEARLRQLHQEVPSRPGVWNRNLEGSYADLESLRSLAGLRVPWLYVDRGHREMIWSDHDNTAHVRWILRHRGIRLAGPPIADLVDDVPEEAMRAEARTALPGILDGIRSWADMDNAWTQRYIVQMYCRILFTLRTGKATSKRDALKWAGQTLDRAWRPLLVQVADDRGIPWKPVDPPRPGSMDLACRFADYVQSIASQE